MAAAQVDGSTTSEMKCEQLDSSAGPESTHSAQRLNAGAAVADVVAKSFFDVINDASRCEESSYDGGDSISSGGITVNYPPDVDDEESSHDAGDSSHSTSSNGVTASHPAEAIQEMKKVPVRRRLLQSSRPSSLKKRDAKRQGCHVTRADDVTPLLQREESVRDQSETTAHSDHLVSLHSEPEEARSAAVQQASDNIGPGMTVLKAEIDELRRELNAERGRTKELSEKYGQLESEIEDLRNEHEKMKVEQQLQHKQARSQFFGLKGPSDAQICPSFAVRRSCSAK